MTERYAEHDVEDALLEGESPSSGTSSTEEHAAGGERPATTDKHSEQAQREQERQMESGEENPT